MPGKALLLVPDKSDGGDMPPKDEGDGEGRNYSEDAKTEAVGMLVDALGVQGANKTKVAEALTQFYENC